MAGESRREYNFANSPTPCRKSNVLGSCRHAAQDTLSHQMNQFVPRASKVPRIEKSNLADFYRNRIRRTITRLLHRERIPEFNRFRTLATSITLFVVACDTKCDTITPAQHSVPQSLLMLVTSSFWHPTAADALIYAKSHKTVIQPASIWPKLHVLRAANRLTKYKTTICY